MYGFFMITENNISHLNDKEIFVFGANCAGIHGLGAAKTSIKMGSYLGTT